MDEGLVRPGERHATRDDGQDHPAITSYRNGFLIAFQANTGKLWTLDTKGGARDSGLDMMVGSSPSVAASGSGYRVAFQGANGMLWTLDSAGRSVDTGRGMMYSAGRGSSPAIAADAGPYSDGYRVVYDAGVYVHTWYSRGGDTNEGMCAKSGTNPAIAAPGGVHNTSYRIAMQWCSDTLRPPDARGALVVTGRNGTNVDAPKLAMMEDTSPAIAAYKISPLQPYDGSRVWMAAFQARTGNLWTRDSAGRTTDTGLAMKADTSPTIAGFSNGFVMAFQGAHGNLLIRDSGGNVTATGLTMKERTSPAIAVQ